MSPVRRLATVAALLLAAAAARAGGPFPEVRTTGGVPIVWSTASPVDYHPDGGALGMWSNATAVAETGDAFDRWGPDIATSALTFNDAGAIPGDGDVSTVAEFTAVVGVCGDGISPIVFDEDGTIFDALFGVGNSLIGFAGPDCALGANLVEGSAAMNGGCFDGDAGDGCEVAQAEFESTFTHEFGHFLNLDHTAVNGQWYVFDDDPGTLEFIGTFGPPPLSSVQLMFPFVIPGASTTPQRDDVAAISALYPTAGYAASVGTITGDVVWRDGVTPFEGANVIARNPTDPWNDVLSNVSGVPYLFTIAGPPGAGTYEIPGLTAGQSYSIEVARVNPLFDAGSGVGFGPRFFPIEEFYNGANESADDPPDAPTDRTDVAATAGVVVSGIDVILNTTLVPGPGLLGLGALTLLLGGAGVARLRRAPSGQ